MEEVNVSPTGISNQYNYFNSSLATNPIIFVIILTASASSSGTRIQYFTYNE